MKSFIDLLKASKTLHFSGPVSSATIRWAENEIGVIFAKEYKEYLTVFGAASANGHEFTGICKAKRLNVVDVTKEEREFVEAGCDWYVVEQANIDGITIWQTPEGCIYLCQGNREPKKIADSLLEYFDK